MNNLGSCYNYGVGTDINKEKAFELLQKASNLGNELAQYNLALMYENGNEVKKNMDQAISVIGTKNLLNRDTYILKIS